MKVLVNAIAHQQQNQQEEASLQKTEPNCGVERLHQRKISIKYTRKGKKQLKSHRFAGLRLAHVDPRQRFDHRLAAVFQQLSLEGSARSLAEADGERRASHIGAMQLPLFGRDYTMI